MHPRRKKSKLNYVLIAVLLFVIAFSVGLWYMSIMHVGNSSLYVGDIHSPDGTWDLTQENFEDNIIVINGELEYIEGKLVEPQDFDSYGDSIKIGTPDQLPVNTVRLTLNMPDDEIYTIMANSIDFAEKIYINGEWRQDIGVVSTTQDSSVPGYAYLTFDVRPVNGVIEIVRQSNNFVHRDNGHGAHWKIGTPSIMKRERAFDFAVDGIIVGIFTTLAITHLFFFSMLQKYKIHLYFTGLTVAWGLRMSVISVKVLGTLFSFLPWEFLFRIEYISMPIAAIMIILIVGEFFAGMLPKWYQNIFISFFMIYALCCIFVPTIPLSYSVLMFEAVYILAAIMLFVMLIMRMIKMRKNKQMRFEHYLFIASYAVVVFAIVNDALYYNNIRLIMGNLILNNLAMLIFIFTQTVALIADTSKKIIDVYNKEHEMRAEAEALKQSTKMKEQFLRNLSHELQIPITTVSGFAQLTDEILKEDETLNRVAIQDNIRIIDDESRKLSRMVAQMLDIFAMENGTFKLHMTKVNINYLIQKIYDLHFPIMNDGSYNLKLDIQENLPFAYADEERTLHVILNLITNAAKHSGSTEIKICAVHKDDFIEISVVDTGKGISEELSEELFSEYPLHRSESGNGLGLYIVAQTIKAQGGTVEIDNKIDIGTKIKFTIPVWETDKE